MKKKKLSTPTVITLEERRQLDKQAFEKTVSNGCIKPFVKASSKKKTGKFDERDISAIVMKIIGKNFPEEKVESEYEKVMNFIGESENRIYFMLARKEFINIAAPSRINEIGTPENEIWMYYMYCDDVSAYVIRMGEKDENGKIPGKISRLSYPKFMEVI